MRQFLLKVLLGCLLSLTLIGGERVVAAGLSLSHPSDTSASSFLLQLENLQEAFSLPTFETSGVSGVYESQVQPQRALGGPVLADVYFDEHRQVIHDRLKGLFLQTIEFLKQEPEWQLRVEGHCDPRGTSAYNLARANFHLMTLSKYLLLLGIQPQQMSILNYGQDPIACRLGSEACQEDNLRAQHVFSNLAIRQTQRGCLARLRLVADQDLTPAFGFTKFLSKVQRIQVASPSSSF